MSVNNEEAAVIIFPIKFQAKEEGTEGEDAGEDFVDPEADEMAARLTDFVQKTDKQGMATLSQFAKNPGQLVENELINTLGRAGVHGALAAAIITALVATPELIRTIVQTLGEKGGPLNQDFHRFFADENQIGIDRDLQFRRAVGLDVIITTEDRGFILSDPNFVNNSLVDIDTTRTQRLSDKDNVYGYVQGM